MMNTSARTTALRDSAKTAFTAKRRQTGTTLVEILVVIVIFLIGILAVLQIFPGGFRLLLLSRNNSAATALGRDEIERLKDHPESLPEDVLAVRYDGTKSITDDTLEPTALNPLGTVDANGKVNGIDWTLASGANVARGIVGEGQRVPAPRQVGNQYGGLLVVEHGPIDPNGPFLAYANDLSRTVGLPRDAVAGPPANSTLATTFAGITAKISETSATAGNVAAVRVQTPVATAPFEFFVVGAATPAATILVPASAYNRVYRLRLSGVVNASGFVRRDFPTISLSVPAVDPSTDATPLIGIRVEDILGAADVLNGATLGSIEVGTVRLAPEYLNRTAAGWSGDPFEAKLADGNLGVLLFSPYAREGIVARPGGSTEPLVAKVDYDVLDWRILREDFRVVNDSASFRLSLQSLKVGSADGFDGRNNGAMPGLEGGATGSPVGVNPTDNVVVVDLATGFRLDEAGLIVDKSRGVVTLADVDGDASNGTQVRLVSLADPVNANNRTFRVLYRARQEWSVQLLKGASQYAILTSGITPTQGQCALGVSLPTLLHFPRSDAGRKVTVDSITYMSGSGVKTMEGQDFLIQYGRVGDSSNLPSIDLRDVDASASAFYFGTAAAGTVQPVQGVKGASVSVRVLWNPETLDLTRGVGTPNEKINGWTRGWRKSTTDTYLRAEETR